MKCTIVTLVEKNVGSFECDVFLRAHEVVIYVLDKYRIYVKLNWKLEARLSSRSLAAFLGV